MHNKKNKQMKEKIENLIRQYKEAKQEVWSLLEELSQIDVTKLDHKENDSLRESKIRFEEEYAWRGVFINSLKDLL